MVDHASIDHTGLPGVGAGGLTVVHRTTDDSVSSTSFADVSSMGFSVGASTDYLFRYIVFFNTNATSVGIKLSVNGPASPTLLKCGAYLPTGAAGTNDTTISIMSITTYDTTFVATTGPGLTNSMAIIEGLFRNGSNAGTLILRHASETATATVVEAGTFGWITTF